jgi:hypothetical protein
MARGHAADYRQPLENATKDHHSPRFMPDCPVAHSGIVCRVNAAAVAVMAPSPARSASMHMILQMPPRFVFGISRPHKAAVGLLASLMLVACGGGGGSSSGGAPVNSGTGPGSTVSSSGIPFPVGMTLASPAALGAATSVVSGGQGIVDLGLNASATPLQSVVSSQVDALATGRLTLAGSNLLSVSALFDTSARGHAACQGPAVAYQNHDDAPGSSGTLTRGSVAMWSGTDISALPCGVAELNAQTQGLSAQANQAMLLMAALRYALAASSSTQMPATGETADLTPNASTLLTTLLGGITIQRASVALNDDGNEYTYRLVLARGSDATAQTLDITLLHTPAETDIRYAGVLQITQSYLSADASIGCSDQLDSASRHKVARLTSLGYNRQDQWLSLRLRSGQYCGHAASAGIGHAGQIAALTMSGELDPSVYLADGTRGTTKGWRQGFLRMGADVVMSSLTGDFVYAWQDLPQGGQGHARLFAGHSTLDSGTGTRTLQLNQGHTDDIAVTDGTLMGLVCNAGGPGSTGTMQALYQSQTMTLGPNATGWALGSSHVRHAPTNSCNASAGMRLDADGDGALASGEGASLTHDLAAPTGGRTDVQDEIIEQGFLPPILLL